MSHDEQGAGDSAEPRRTGGVVGWVLFALLLLYTLMIHHGIGPEPGRSKGWYSPSSFLFSAPVVSGMFETIREALALFVLPAMLLTVGVFLTTKSSLARAVSISCVLCCATFVYYGVEADRVWTFFHWRASAVLTLMCFAVGFAISAPFLAASWLRLGWPARIAVYLPFLLGVLAFVRNATGTDPSLQFAISPWPAIPVFGIELGGLMVMVLLVGLALGVGGIAYARSRQGGLGFGALAFVLGVVVPGVLLLIGDWLRIFPFRLDGGVVAATAVVAAIAIAIGATLRLRGPDAMRLRGQHLAVGAALLAIPLIGGEAMARYDYYVTREVRAREVIDALARYLEREEIYPDELEELVEAGDLAEIPSPAIGFGFLYDEEFRYRSFGTSFILEFPAPRWVECAYTPPYAEEDEGGDENWGVGGYDNPNSDDADYVQGDVVTGEDVDVAAGGDDDTDAADDDEAKNAGAPDVEEGDSLGEAWSCPSTPPELW